MKSIQIDLNKIINWKNIIVISLIIFILFSVNRCVSDSKKINMYEKEKKIDTLTIKKWRDEFNNEHTKVKSNEINFANLLNAKDGELLKLRQDLAKDKSIIGKTILKTTTSGEIKVKLSDKITLNETNDVNSSKDTLKTKIFLFKDKFLGLSGEIFTNDSLKLKYSIKNEYDLFTKYKNNGIFKRNSIEVEIVNKNPATITDKIQVFTIQQPPKKFYETKLFTYGLGMISGAIINNQINK